jgi:hypothetical protein
MTWLDLLSQIHDMAVRNGLMNEFVRLHSNIERIRFLYRHRTNLIGNQLEQYLLSSLNDSSKHATNAADYRMKGNEHFIERNLERASWHYRACIALSPVDSNEKLLAYGNLSAVLFELAHYQDCIDMIHIVYDIYPNELKYKFVH